jgi:hypothetical protein
MSEALLLEPKLSMHRPMYVCTFCVCVCWGGGGSWRHNHEGRVTSDKDYPIQLQYALGYFYTSPSGTKRWTSLVTAL